MHNRPAIVPVWDDDEYLRILTLPSEGTADLCLVRGIPESQDDNTRQFVIPTTDPRTRRDFRSLGSDGALEEINKAMNALTQLLRQGHSKRVIFPAQTPDGQGGLPLFARGEMGYDVQLYITDRIYELGTFVYCVSHA